VIVANATIAGIVVFTVTIVVLDVSIHRNGRAAGGTYRRTTD
jgi:hypothetical protein